MTDTTPSTSTVWIVGVDGSEHARHAALWAVANAPGRADELRLLTVWHAPVSAFYPGGYAAPFREAPDLESSSWEYVNRLADSFRANAAVPITTAAASGGAADVLLDAEPERGLIVVGSRGRGGFKRLLVGSTSTQVATHASVPCAVVPAEAPVGRVQRMAVAVDGSENSLAALDWALDFAPAGGTVDCITVADIGGTLPADVEAVAAAEEAEAAHVAALIDDRAAAGPPDIQVAREHATGRARQLLKQHGEQRGLLVMGARGRGAIGAALLGSVSTWLLHHANVPMVVVPSGGR